MAVAPRFDVKRIVQDDPLERIVIHDMLHVGGLAGGTRCSSGETDCDFSHIKGR